MSLRLDTSRNQLLVADTVLAVITLAISCGSFVGSLYGMNLINHQEDKQHTFAHVCYATIIFIVTLSITIIGIFIHKGLIPSKMYRTWANNEHTYNQYHNINNNHYKSL